MRRIAHIAVMLIGVLAMTGCAKFDELFNGKTEKITFVASFADETRTSYQGEGKVDWVEGDMIRYYSTKNGAIGEYEVVRSSHNTNVVADVASGTSYIIAAYGGENITDNGVTSFTLNGAVKATQSGKFEDAHVSVAKAFDIVDGASLSFHNMTSIIKFSIDRSDVAYITFTARGGEKIHGDGVMTVTFADDQPSAAFGEGGGSSIRVNTIKAGTYFISTLPVDLLDGFEICYFDTSGELVFNTVFDKAFHLGNNEIIDLGSLDDRLPEYVDLGLSVMWSTCNLGAIKPEDYGDYYQWGGLEDVTNTSIYLDFSNCPYHTGSDQYTGWTKYIPLNRSSYWSGSGNPDNKTVLDPKDDAAHVKLGGKWRMPTIDDFKELKSNCSLEWVVINGVKGARYTSNINGNSIFLPAETGERYYDKLSTGYSNYWSSSFDDTYPDLKNYAAVFCLRPSRIEDIGRISRYFGCPVRPVYGNVVKVTGVNISNTRISLPCGAMSTLKATVTPTNSAEKSVSWTSSNPAVATVDANGKVTAAMTGNATITAKSLDGGHIATCDVTVIPTEYVDLGLSVKWATCNLGAAKPEEYGGYYQWAGLDDVSDTSIYLDWNNCPYHTGQLYFTGWTKYVPSNYSSYWSGSGSPDNKTVLDPEDDVAHARLGGKWRMPTSDEYFELTENCSSKWTVVNGVKGVRFTSNINGNSIFLPAAGYRSDTLLYDVGSNGNYWSSSRRGSPEQPDGLCLDSSYVFFLYSYCRCSGQSVRPVSE